MDVLYLSHCVPNPPDKGEKIRAFHELERLSAEHSVHLVCFAKQRAEVRFAKELESRCASVYVEALRPSIALMKAAARFAMGGCLTTSYYFSRKMLRHVQALPHLDATVVYSSAMAQYAPREVPVVLDMVDVDSEKWLQYSKVRFPRFAYSVEGARLRRKETEYGQRALCTFLSTEAETELFRNFAPRAVARTMGNGVDFEYFDPAACPNDAALASRCYIVFVGAMDYFPNADAVTWFAEAVFPALRKQVPELEFIIAGRDPSPAVQRLAQTSGVVVTGSIPDVRPYLVNAVAVVAPLRIARGIQNKVLEALALGKTVYASDAVCRTLGSDLPLGVICCEGAQAFQSHLAERVCGPAPQDDAIRRAAKARFTWDANIALVAGSTRLRRRAMRIVYHHRTRASDAQGVHILEMVNAFRNLGHEVEIVSLVETEKRQPAVEDDSKDAWWKTLMRKLPFFAEMAQIGYNVLGFALLARRLRVRTDFIYERYSLFTFAGVVAAKMFRIPLVLEVNSPLALEQHQHKEIRSFALGNWLERQICNAASVVVVVSTPLKRILAANHVSESKFLLLPNGINPAELGHVEPTADPAALLPVNGRVVIGFVGWFRAWHGLEMLVEAFHHAGLERNAVLMMVGDGPAKPDLDALVAKYGMQQSVIFTGPVPHEDVGNYIRRFDIAMQPAANAYCCPMKIIEYMGMGKVILAPRQENIQELLQENEEAILFKPGDRAEMEAALSRLTADAELRTRLGAAARKAIDTRRLLWSANAESVISRVAEV